jgi:hypothetical protein
VRQYASSASHADPGFGSVLRNVLSTLWTADPAQRNIHEAINARNQTIAQ